MPGKNRTGGNTKTSCYFDHGIPQEATSFKMRVVDGEIAHRRSERLTFKSGEDSKKGEGEMREGGSPKLGEERESKRRRKQGWRGQDFFNGANAIMDERIVSLRSKNGSIF